MNTNNNDIRFSSIKDFFKANKDVLSYNMEAPYDDVYQVKIQSKIEVTIKDIEEKILANTTQNFNVELSKGQKIVLELKKLAGKVAKIQVMALHNKEVQPYEPYGVLDITNKDARKDDDVSPSYISAVKRDDGKGIYINCNNPEKLTDDDINKCLSRVNISDKKVFFTFEHNDYEKPFYYGYKVINKDKQDIYITILNLGYQISGSGRWLGEDEWTQFYNTNFRYDDSSFTADQKDEFVRMFNFSNKCKAKKYQPITYRIPKGKYIYVMGGTTKDAYKHINVFNQADKLVKPSCSNGVVLFDVHGKAEGTFYVYNDIKKIKDDNSHQGYVLQRNGKEYGRQYVGYDNCHGVVDNHIVLKFNDETNEGNLKFRFINYHEDERVEKGKPYQPLARIPHDNIKDYFATHINAQWAFDGLGTDMTLYNTVDDKGKEICISPDALDGNGLSPNIGNWMVDYMDYYYLVNKGNKERTVTINMKNTGSLCVMVKDINGKVKKNTPMFTLMVKSDRGEKYNIQNDFTYDVKVKPRSVVKFIVEYNLLANSCGYVTHRAILK